MVQIRVDDLAAILKGRAIGDLGLCLTRIGPLMGATPETVSFLANPKYQSQLSESAAGCVLLGEAHETLARNRPSAILCRDPYLAYAYLSQWWAQQSRPARRPGVHDSAVIAESAVIHPTATIGPLSVIGERAVIGPQVVVGAQACIEADAQLGQGSRLGVRCVLGQGCRVGARVLMHPGVVIGADGFGFAPHDGRWEKIEQLGAVQIGNDVEIGANTCIDRGALEDTVIEDGVKLDNLIQIGHNVRVGAHTAMAGCVGVAGSARIGAHCTVGGGAIILGHLELVDHVHVSAATVVTRSILKPGQYSGVFPFDDNAAWEKNAATLRQLHSMRQRLRVLETKLK